MNNGQTSDALNRLLAIHQRSFPMYLCSAPPFVGEAGQQTESDRQAIGTLDQIAKDQTTLSRRIAGLIISSGGQLETGDFPMEFTDMHDLTIDFIVRRTVGYQRQDIASIEQCVDSLRLAPAALALAEEALGMAKGQLESLEELVRDKVSVAGQ